MTDKSKKAEVGDFVSSERASEIFQKEIMHETTRMRVISIVDDYVDNVKFVAKIKKYASEEMDNRIFRSWKYWITVVVTAVITALVSGMIAIWVFNSPAR